MLVRYKNALRTRSKRALARDAVLLFLGIVFISVAFSALWAATLEMPQIDNFESRAISNSTKIYDHTGKTVLYNIGDNIKRTVVPLDSVSPYIASATIAIEDAYFYEHHGIRPTSLIRAFIANAQSRGYSQGASTITQQVVKNALLTKDKTVTRKIKEIILAVRLDKQLSKNDILTIYLNESPYGGTIYGVEEASIQYFGKKAKDVTLTEAAYLAALPQRPTFLNPYGKNREALEARKNLVLSRMQELSFITEAEKLASQKEYITFKPKDMASGRALHFVMYIREYLENKYGVDMVTTGGLKVISSIDIDIQRNMEDIVKEGALSNEKKYKATNAALVAIDPKTGYILSMVGSRDFEDTKIDGQYNVAISPRQPGSSFKPIVYAQALKDGYTPETVLFDVPTNFSTACDAFGTPLPGYASSSCYMPVNYDGRFRGPVTIREALAQSLNIPAVKLLYLVGLKDAITLAKNLGLSTIGSANQYGLTLVLGGGEVTLLDLVGAYGAFANNGIFNKPVSIIEVRDRDGVLLEQYQPSPLSVLPQSVTAKLSSILSDNVARTPAYGVNNALYFGARPVAVKTGTTNDYHDVWTVGYTPSLALGMWGGNNDNTPIDKRVAGAVIAPIWHKAFEKALNGSSIEYFPEPPVNTEDKDILKGNWCTASGIHTILNDVNKSNPQQDPLDPTNDSQYELWNTPILAWAAENSACGYSISTSSPLQDSTTTPNTAFQILTNPQQPTSQPAILVNPQ